MPQGRDTNRIYYIKKTENMPHFLFDLTEAEGIIKEEDLFILKEEREEKIMKKLVNVLLVLCLVLGLTACGEKETKAAATCTLEQNNVVIKMIFDAKGDEITKITQETVVDIEGYSEDDVQILEDSIKNAGEAFEAIDGVEYSTENSDNKITEKIVIPTDKDTLQAVVKAGLLPVDNEEVTKLSLEDTVNNLEEAGWTAEN